jgi:hypothetical protein
MLSGMCHVKVKVTPYHDHEFLERKYKILLILSEPGSSVSIVTELRAGRSVDLIPVGAKCFAHVQTGPGSHPAFCTMGTESFPGVKRPGRGADHPHPPSAEVENEWGYTSTPPLGP